MAIWLSFPVRTRGATCHLRHPNAKPAPCVMWPRRVGARCLNGRVAASRLTPAARAVSRWLWSTYALRKRALWRREALLLRRAAVVRCGRCGLPMLRQQRFERRTPAVSVSGEEARHASLLRADGAPRCFWSSRIFFVRTLRWGEASLLRCAWSWCDVAAAASQRQASAVCHAAQVG